MYAAYQKISPGCAITRVIRHSTLPPHMSTLGDNIFKRQRLITGVCYLRVIRHITTHPGLPG